jgi:hypothetical protein
MSRVAAVGPIPAFLSHLPKWGEYPVPFVQMWLDGKPDFRIVDPNRIERCVKERLCAICGHKLCESVYFIGGPAAKENHLFGDPGMHEKCAAFAARTCPFVSGRQDGYSSRPVDESKVRTQPLMSPVRPPDMFILRTRTFRSVVVNDSPMILAGRWIGEKPITG